MWTVGQISQARIPLAHDHADCPLALEDDAQRRRYLLRSEGAGGGLIEQRLEEVTVATVDERHHDRSKAKPADGLKTAKATTHHNDSVLLARRVHTRCFIAGSGHR
jgi:hypothetical protein